MDSILESAGNAIMFLALAYIYLAVRYADSVYAQILTVDPEYFSELDRPSVHFLSWKRSLGVVKFIFDRGIRDRGYPEDLKTRIDNAKGFYFGGIFAFFAFLIGIFIR